MSGMAGRVRGKIAAPPKRVLIVAGIAGVLVLFGIIGLIVGGQDSEDAPSRAAPAAVEPAVSGLSASGTPLAEVLIGPSAMWFRRGDAVRRTECGAAELRLEGGEPLLMLLDAAGCSGRAVRVPLGASGSPARAELAEVPDSLPSISFAARGERLLAQADAGEFEFDGPVWILRGWRAVWLANAAPAGWHYERLRLAALVDSAQAEADAADPQGWSVYDWEWEVAVNLLPAALGGTITADRVTELVETVFADQFGSDEPVPELGLQAGEDSEYRLFADRIVFGAEAGLRPWIVLHELAHAVQLRAAEQTGELEIESHGRQFAATLLGFWTRYVPGFDREAAEAAAAAHFADASALVHVPVGGEAGKSRVRAALGFSPAE